VQCETLSRRGVGQLLDTIDDVRAYTNAGLRVLGVVATMFNRRTRLARTVLAEIGDQYGVRVLEPPIPKTVRVAEAPGRGRSVLAHASGSTAAAAYRDLAATVEAA
jgi:chromosome partitioning protein